MSWRFFSFFFFSQHDVFELDCRLLLQSQKLNSVTTYMHVTNMCLFQCLWAIALTIANLIFIVQQFLFFSQGSRSPWLRWEQFLHRPDTNRILLPHHGWPWGSGGHCRQDCRHRLHAAPSGQGRLPWSVRLRLGKRVVDTAVKTADMGYMHRHLVKVDCCDQSGYG